MCWRLCVFLFYADSATLDIHVLTHSFPTRRSSDLRGRAQRRLVAEGEEGFAASRRGAGAGNAQHLVRLQVGRLAAAPWRLRSEEHTSELQSLMRISYAVFCLKKKT